MMNQDAQQEKSRQVIHDARNRLNRISMQVELAKMLLEQDAPAEQIRSALDKSLAACEECSDELTNLSEFL